MLKTVEGYDLSDFSTSIPQDESALNLYVWLNQTIKNLEKLQTQVKPAAMVEFATAYDQLPEADEDKAVIVLGVPVRRTSKNTWVYPANVIALDTTLKEARTEARKNGSATVSSEMNMQVGGRALNTK